MMFRIGISGWSYKGWRGVFYPPKLPHRRELEHASRIFNAIEINGTHYSLQRPESFQSWYAESPPGFLFTVKGGRFITHMKKLRDVEAALANFVASGVLALKDKLGPFLWQLPPNLGFHPDRMEEFFAQLPRDTEAAARLARNHTDQVAGRCWTDPGGDRALRHCVEVRHASFMTPEFFEMLRRWNIAFVFADTAGRWPYAEDLTADFVYVRLHGAEQLYVSGYSDSALDWWANRLRHWARGAQPADATLVSPKPKKRARIEDVFVFFDNDAKVHAPFDAQRLAARLGAAEPRLDT